VKRVFELDHNYSYADDKEEIKQHCDYLRNAIADKDAQEKNLRRRLSRALATKKELREIVVQLRDDHLISSESAAWMERFDGNVLIIFLSFAFSFKEKRKISSKQ